MNVILHKLTGKKSGFENPFFNLDSGIEVGVSTVRDILIPNQNVDYYAHHYLSLLLSYPDIMRYLPAEEYPPLTPRPFQVLNGELRHFSVNAPKFKCVADTFPPVLSVEVEKVSASRASLKMGSVVYGVDYSGEEAILIDWPSNFDVSGALYASTWGMLPIVIEFWPTPPWKALVSILEPRSDVQDILRRLGWLDEFSRSTPDRKVALVCAALVLCL